MRLHLTAKEPGPGGIRLRPVSLDLSYATTFDQASPDAYERLLMDVIKGNPTLFMRRDEVEAAWQWVEPILTPVGIVARPSEALPGRHHRPHRRRDAPRARRPKLAGARPMSRHPSRPRRGHRPPRRAQQRQPIGVPPPHPRRRRQGPGPRQAGLRQPRPRLRRLRRRPPSRRCAARTKPNVAIVSSYNDMLSAHQPFETYPRELKKAVIRGRRHRAVRRRRARDVRRHHPGPRRHAALAVQPRRDRDVDGDRAVARHVRRRADARRLRQDRARPADRGAVLRAPADRVRARRADGLRAAERREGADPPGVRRGQGRPRGAARGRGRVVPLGRHLHVLRHRELQPADHGGARPAPARLVLREPGHAAARGADPRRRRAGDRADPAGRRVHPDRRDRRREGDRQRLRRAARQPAARRTTRCTWSRSPAPRASR